MQTNDDLLLCQARGSDTIELLTKARTRRLNGNNCNKCISMLIKEPIATTRNAMHVVKDGQQGSFKSTMSSSIAHQTPLQCVNKVCHLGGLSDACPT